MPFPRLVEVRLPRHLLCLLTAVLCVTSIAAPAGSQQTPTATTTTTIAPTTTTTTIAPTTTSTTTTTPPTTAPTTEPATTVATTAAPVITPDTTPATTAAEVTVPADPVDDGGGDAGDDITPPDAGSSDGNTGGGTIVGDNPIRELASGIWETPVLVGGAAGAEGVSLGNAAAAVRDDARSAAFEVEERRTAAKSVVIEAQTELVQAERALNDAERRLEDRRRVREQARVRLARMSVASYTNLYGENDPDVLAMMGETMRSSIVREYSGTVMVSADQDRRKANDGFEAARDRVDTLERTRNAAKARVAESKKALSNTEQELAKAVNEAKSLDLDPAESTDLPDLPEGALGTTTTGEALSGPSAALAALLAQDLSVTYPIAGTWNFLDSWGYPRSGGRTHQGNDLFSRYGTPVVAVEDGVVRVAFNSLGGNTVYLYGRSGNRYYYAHLSAVVDGVDGRQVQAGQILGKVGTSGNAIGTPPHLHFEVKPPGGETSNPYPMLKALALAVMQARDLGAQPTVRAQDVVALPDAVGRTLWSQGRIRSDTLALLGTDAWVNLIRRTVLPVEALALADPRIAAQVAKRLPGRVDAASLPEVVGGITTTSLPPVALPADAKAPVATPLTSQPPINPGSAGMGG